MNTKRLFKQLKNGQLITSYYKLTDLITYTINLKYENNKFRLHSYYLEGGDITVDEYYKDEKIREYQALNEMLQVLKSEFPEIKID